MSARRAGSRSPGRRAVAPTRRSLSLLAGAPLRYRIFYTTPDGLDGRCEVIRHRPIAGDDDVDALERALMSWFGHSNALVIGWQRCDAVAVPAE